MQRPMDSRTQYSNLLANIADGDREAFSDLYFQASPKLFGVAMRILGDADKAADAMQDGFVQIWQNASHFTASKGAAEAWMAGIVRFRALDILRKDRTRATLIDDRTEIEDGFLIMKEPTEALLALKGCIDRLGDAEKKCVLEAYMNGYTHEELSIRLEAPLGTVKSRLRRSMFALKECLSQ